MRVVSDFAVAIACLSATLFVLFYLSKRRGVARDDGRAMWIVVAGFAAFAASRFLDVALVSHPDLVLLEIAQLAATFLALASSLAVWAFVPGLLARPAMGELLEQFRALTGAAEQSAEEMERLAAIKAELEQAVAERTRALDEINQRFVRALTDTGVSMSQQDRDLRYVWIHNAPQGLKKVEFVGRLQAEVLPPELEPRIAEAKHRAMRERSSLRIDVQAEINGEPRWFDERIGPILRDGEVVGVMTTSIDVTVHRRQEEHLRALLRELTHRTKNLLAVIQGIARQSGRTAGDVESFVTQFNGRIRVLSITHELLVNSSWSGVDLRTLLDAVWLASAPLAHHRLILSGESRILAPESAQNLALAFHEMAANAIERGASPREPDGVRISWTPSGVDGDRAMALTWEEDGGAPSPARTLSAFGKTYVETLLPRATGGVSEITATDTGFRWRLTLPQRNFIS
ncbi:MAG TPA: HWE histidine kinase domain-containing protein [Rhodoblastus sp.]|nr:HWE histidine kinase domain-containing protein [Rhodoblastus sp.]